MKKYLSLTKMSLKRHLTYRARFINWLIVDLSQVFIFPFIWLAIYGERDMLGGFTRADIVMYYVVLAFVSLTTTSHHSHYITRDILDGKMSAKLLLPLRYVWYHWFSELGYHIATLGVMSVLLILFIALFPEYSVFPSHAATWLLFAISLIIANFISASIQIMVGLGSFWLGEVHALSQLRFLIEKIFSGEFAPLTLYPVFIRSIALSLPFQFIHFVPIQIYLEKISFVESIKTLGVGFVWLLIFFVTINIIWRQGVKRYDGAGI